MKGWKLTSIGTDEGEESQGNCIDPIFKKIIEEKFSKLMKDILKQVQISDVMSHRQDHKRKYLHHIKS